MLINTSSGGLLDYPCYSEAHKSEQLGYLVLLCTGKEEKVFFHYLSEDIIQDDVILRWMSFPNVLITAHQGILTDKVLTPIALVTTQNVYDCEAGESLEQQVK